MRERGFSVGLISEAQRIFSAQLAAAGDDEIAIEALEELISDLAFDPAEWTDAIKGQARVVSVPVFGADGAVAMALILVALVALFFITTIVRLGGTVAIPTAFAVVTDAAHTRRQFGIDTALLGSKQGHKVFEQKRRANGVDLERTGQLRGVDRTHVFFRPLPVDAECTCGIDDEVKRALQ